MSHYVILESDDYTNSYVTLCHTNKHTNALTVMQRYAILVSIWTH